MKILEIKKINKSFDDKKIINEVSFDIEEGKIVGLLGKNGSGKKEYCHGCEKYQFECPLPHMHASHN